MVAELFMIFEKKNYSHFKVLYENVLLFSKTSLKSRKKTSAFILLLCLKDM